MVQQYIPNEARELLRDGQYAIVNDEILIGSYKFPFDIIHILEVFEAVSLRIDVGTLNVMIEFSGHAMKRIFALLEEMPTAELEQYRDAVTAMVKQLEEIAESLK